MKSGLYKCPKCREPVDITASFEGGEDYGEVIAVVVTCRYCGESRVDEIDELVYNFSELVAKLAN